MRPAAFAVASCLVVSLFGTSSSAEGQLPSGAAAAPGPAAPDARTITLTGEEALVVALEVMLRSGQLAEALTLLQSLSPERRAQPDIALIEGQLLRRRGETRRAADIYRRLLAAHPGDQRIRLELAESLFEIKDLRASEHFFRLALSGDLPADDRRLARSYLNQVLSLRPWTITGGLGLAPDTNVNGATSAREVEIWGLPFELSQEARQRSGVNLNAYVNAEGSVKLGEGARLVGGAWAQASENRDRAVSSEGAGIRVGPEFARRERRWSLMGTAERRWHGGQVYYSAGGASLAGDLAMNQGLSVYSAALSVQRLAYDRYQRRDGWLHGLDVLRTRYISPQLLWRASLSLRANRAAADEESYDSARLAIGGYRSLPWRLGVFVEPSVAISRYRASDAFFGVVREDREVALSARLVKEDYSVWGFAPYVGGAVSHTSSTIPLFAYDRTRGEVGLTRTF